LNRVLETQTSAAQALETVADAVARCAPLAALLFFEPQDNGRLSSQPQWLFGAVDWSEDLSLPPLLELCQQAWVTRRTRVGTPLEGLLFTTIAVPVMVQDGNPRVLCAALSPEAASSADHLLHVLEFAALQLSVWFDQQAARSIEQEARISAALLEVVSQVNSSRDLSAGCRAVVNAIQPFLGAQRVALGLCRSHSGACQLLAISGLAKFDQYAELTQALEAALDETVMRAELIEWPQPNASSRPGARTHEQLLAVANAKSVVSGPLFGDQPAPVGAWLVLDPQDSAARMLLQAAQHPLGSSLNLLDGQRRTLLSRVAELVLQPIFATVGGLRFDAGNRLQPAACLPLVAPHSMRL
jgi:hypothetical protein